MNNKEYVDFILNQTIGILIRKEREKNNLTLDQLAKKSGVSKQNIYYYEEVWKKIDGYDNYYVSTKGNIASVFPQAIKRNSQDKGFVVKIIKPVIVAGYSCVSLKNNDGVKLLKVHRLVAKAFIKNKKGLEQVNHKDENKQNNNVNNLEWCDCRYNNNYGNRIKKVKVKLSVPVACYDLNDNKIKEYKSLQSVKADGFNPSKVCSVCKHKYGRNTHKGYIWKYI